MTIADAEEEAKKARMALSRFDHESRMTLELGECLTAQFYEAMGQARVSVMLAERAVNKLKEMER